MRRVLAFLTEECCDGHPELCGDMAGPWVRDGGTRAAMSDRVYNVLFLCTGNSARSILGEAILNRLGDSRFRAHSAGSHPKGAVHPYALDLLRNQNYPVDGLRSKSWDEFAAPGAPVMDFVFTVCDDAAAEVCPAWPGQPITAHWGVPDPAAAEGSEAERRYAFADALRMLHNRISIFANLPIRSLDRLALQERVDNIGSQAAEAV
jgi:arsenate reductase